MFSIYDSFTSHNSDFGKMKPFLGDKFICQCPLTVQAAMVYFTYTTVVACVGFNKHVLGLKSLNLTDQIGSLAQKSRSFFRD
jgi:hypothetical protein